MLLESLIALLLLWITLVVLQSFIHNYLITELHETPFYLQWFVVRGIVAICHGSFFYLMNFYQWLPVLAFQLLTHVIIFAPLLNKLRHKNYFYLGEHSGWFDKIFIGDPVLYKTFYFLCVGLLAVDLLLLYDLYI